MMSPVISVFNNLWDVQWSSNPMHLWDQTWHHTKERTYSLTKTTCAGYKRQLLNPFFSSRLQLSWYLEDQPLELADHFLWSNITQSVPPDYTSDSETTSEAPDQQMLCVQQVGLIVFCRVCPSAAHLPVWCRWSRCPFPPAARPLQRLSGSWPELQSPLQQTEGDRDTVKHATPLNGRTWKTRLENANVECQQVQR